MDKDTEKSKAQQKGMEVANAFTNASSQNIDPLGSYTGKSYCDDDERCIPEQDADDL